MTTISKLHEQVVPPTPTEFTPGKFYLSGKDPNGGQVVILATDPTSGTVVWTSRRSQPIGHHSSGWSPLTFVELIGKITIEQNVVQ